MKEKGLTGTSRYSEVPNKRCRRLLIFTFFPASTLLFCCRLLLNLSGQLKKFHKFSTKSFIKMSNISFRTKIYLGIHFHQRFRIILTIYQRREQTYNIFSKISQELFSNIDFYSSIDYYQNLENFPLSTIIPLRRLFGTIE